MVATRQPGAEPALRTVDLLTEVATRYYLSGESQTEIARHLGLAPSTVSRYLQRARDEGIVHVEIRPPRREHADLGREVAERFDVSRVVVAGDGPDELAAVAADFLDTQLRVGLRLGVSWGRTLADVVRHLRPGSVSRISVAQLAGGVDDAHPGIQGHELVSEIAVRYPDSRVHYLHAPAIVQSAAVRETMLLDDSISAALDAARRCDVALVGIGEMGGGATLVRGRHVAIADWRALGEAGAVGNLNTRFFDAAGAPAGDLDSRTIAVDWADLRAIPSVIAVAAGGGQGRGDRRGVANAKHRDPDHGRADGDPAGREGLTVRAARSPSHATRSWRMATPGRTAIVTGGGTGIGAAIARRLAARGTAVAIVGRREDRLRASADAIAQAGGEVLVLPADMADAATPARIVSAVLDAWGRLDVVVNNAAHIRNIRLEDLDAAEFDLHYATNLRGPMLLVQAALPALRRSGSAAVVNISSSSGSLSIPSQLMYASMKAALEFATRLLAAELAPDHIRVNAIAPGPIDTEIHLLWARDLEFARVALRDAIPLGQIGQPDDIARWVDYLTRPDETFITGAVIPVDGGQTLNGWKSSIGDAAGDAEPVATGGTP